MSKLLVAFVHGDDAQRVSEELRARGYRFTHLPSLGGFLERENATIVLGIEDEDEADVVDVFETVCQRRDVEVPLVLLERLVDWQAATVTHGGATILVADLANVIRI